MEKDKLKVLFARYLDNELSPGEIRQLFKQLESEQDFSDIRLALREKITRARKQNVDDDPGMQLIYDKIYQKILLKTADTKEVIRPLKRSRWPRVAAAAAIALLLSIGGYFLFFHTNYSAPQFAQTLRPANDIAPGGNKAILTLIDGSLVVLDEAAIGELAEQAGIQVSKTKEGLIVYEAAARGKKETAAVSYHTVSTPMGGQYQVILPDGTKVWLNAASTLRYPIAFTSNERKVILKGEAYFEVTHNESKPFFVKSGGQEIQVLGTRFNVMAYEEEQESRTTLLEGSVKIIAGNDRQLLKPGQQARVAAGKDKITVVPVNTGSAIAWKNGKFMFEGEKLQGIMRKISRWYNVEIIYRGEVTNDDFIGTVSRSENVSEVLNLLELTGTVHFKIENPSTGAGERRIIVMP